MSYYPEDTMVRRDNSKSSKIFFSGRIIQMNKLFASNKIRGYEFFNILDSCYTKGLIKTYQFAFYKQKINSC